MTLFLPDGSTGGASELSRLLGHINKDIFKNVYAFGLTELQDFETLNRDAVRDRIYSAGTGIGAISLSKIQSNLENEAGNLFKERGSKPEINALFRTLNEINTNLKEIENDPEQFDEAHKELEEVTEKVVKNKQKLSQINNESIHVKNLITIWDDWRLIQEARERLRDIPKIENFPEKGIQLLER